MGTGLRLRARDAKENPAKVLAMVLFIMFIISALLLLLLALLLYRLELSEAVVKVAVIVIYIITGLTGGILMGKKIRDTPRICLKIFWLACKEPLTMLCIPASI